MTDLQKAVATQLANIEKKTGKSLAELKALIAASGLDKHGLIRDMLKRDLGLGHGDANTLTHVALNPSADPARSDSAPSLDAELDRIYSGAKAKLRPLHDALLQQVQAFGSFEQAPKKTYVSLRRSKQFAMIGPATQSQIEVGLNLKNAAISG